MKPLSFHRGTLIVEFPSAYADAVEEIEAREFGTAWCVRLSTSRGEIIGAGECVYSGANVYVSGGQVVGLPDWWARGIEMLPEPWSVVEMFGRSHDSVRVGQDLSGVGRLARMEMTDGENR